MDGGCYITEGPNKMVIKINLVLVACNLYAWCHAVCLCAYIILHEDCKIQDLIRLNRNTLSLYTEPIKEHGGDSSSLNDRPRPSRLKRSRRRK
jgi:hypothetical protein